MTELRNKLRSISFKNKGLQSVLRSCSGAVEILSVEEHKGGIHNTKVIFLMKDGERRVQFYDRVDITLAVPSSYISSGNITQDILNLNSVWGCDFTEDDVVLVDGKLKAKSGSLGYHNVEEVPGGVPTTLLGDSITFNLSSFQTRDRQDAYPKLLIRIGEVDQDGEIIEESTQLAMFELPIAASWIDMAEQEIKRFFTQGPVSTMFSINSVQGKSLEYGFITHNYLITLTNETDKPLEICINALGYRAVNGEAVGEIFPILTNTRLTPKGALAPYSATSDTARLTQNDFVNFHEGLYGGDEYPSVTYHGELLSINGSTRNSYWPVPGESTLKFNDMPAPLNPYIESSYHSSIGPLVRIFIDTDSWDNKSIIGESDQGGDYRHAEDKVQLLVKNLSPTPIQINYAGFASPINLLPHENKTHPDEVLLALGPVALPHWNKEEISGTWGVSINGEEYVPSSSESRNYSTFFNDLFDEYPELKPMLNLQMMVDCTSEIQYLYARNKTTQTLDVSIFSVTGEVGNPARFILEPAGTPGITPTSSKSYLEVRGELDVFADLEITNIEEIVKVEMLWRGLVLSGAINESFFPFVPVSIEDGDEQMSLFVIAPFLETVALSAILLDGTRKSLTYRLPPCPFATPWKLGQGPMPSPY